MRSTRSILLVLLSLAAVACSSSTIMDASTSNLGVGATCSAVALCRSDLACEPTSGTCQPQATGAAGATCTLTAECMATPPLYCAPGPMSMATCQAAGTAAVGATCTSTGSCVRGAVCVRAMPGLYGTCEAPLGSTLPGGDGGTTGDGSSSGGDGGSSGTASDVGGACTGVLDCLAGLVCDTAAHVCESPALVGTASTTWTGVTCTPDTNPGGGVRSYFEVPAADGTPPHDFFRLPFPNDIRRSPSTGHLNLTGFPDPTPPLPALGEDLVARYIAASQTDLDGFGVNQYVYFRFSDVFNLSTLGLGTTVRIVDLTGNATPGNVHFGASTGSQTPYLCANELHVSVSSGFPFAPGHTFGVLLTNGILDNGGQAVQPDTDFTAMLGAAAPSDPVLASAYAAYAPLRTYLVAHPLTAGTSLINAAVFTTQHVTDEVGAIRTAVRAQPAPATHGFVLCGGSTVSPCDDGLTGAAHTRGCPATTDPALDELQGTVDVPIMQAGTRPYSTPGDGAIQFDSMGNPIVNGSEQVCVSVTVPHGVSMPAAGWPVVLFAHGTGGNYRDVITEGLAHSLSSVTVAGGPTVNFATVGYDGVMTGTRRGAGVTDSPDVLFFNFANPQAARDNVLQGAADVFSFVRALETISIAMLPTSADTTSFDATKILFVGHSQGSTVGVPAAAWEPNLAGMVFSGAGGDLRQSLLNKRNPVDIADLAPLILEDPSVASAGDAHPALNLFQAYFERSDAVNYGNLMISSPPASVPNLRPFVQTYGIGDTYSPVPTLQALADSFGIPAAAPVPVEAMPFLGATATPLPLPVSNNISPAQGGMVTAALLESDPMGAYDGHFVLFNDMTLQGHVLNFLATTATGTATIE